jgi:hypothetical protein
VLAEEHIQLGGVFLAVSHVVEKQLGAGVDSSGKHPGRIQLV